MSQESYEMKLPGTRFFGSGFFEIANPDDPSDVREVFLAAYHSPLGSALNEREPTPTELAEIRAACRFLVDLAWASAAGEPDDYFIELADGDGPIDQISPSHRTVFGFDRESGCDANPVRIEVS